jgi:excisionase family DNA binding protein
MSVADTLEALAISRSTFYVLVAAGELETVKVGSATRTVVSSAEAYVERLRAQAKAA